MKKFISAVLVFVVTMIPVFAAAMPSFSVSGDKSSESFALTIDTGSNVDMTSTSGGANFLLELLKKPVPIIILIAIVILFFALLLSILLFGLSMGQDQRREKAIMGIKASLIGLAIMGGLFFVVGSLYGLGTGL